ncbi:MAG: iron-containing alcohol dehydrogenase [Planctomycetia bacterium]|nr:iron-containing alcohol dehydrogenase [Planctomycetia bacterium]
MFEKFMNIDTVSEIRARSFIYFGFGAIKKMNDIAELMKAKGINRVLVVSSHSAYKTSGAWDPIEQALREKGMEWILYDKVTPNPDTTAIDEATAQAKEFGAQAVIGIGGGSPIDTAKSVAILAEYPDQNAESLFEWKFAPEKALPIVAVNLTHGTGTEGNRVAVASIVEKKFKPAIAYECLYPTWSIDDPDLMMSLPPKQILYTSIDALNHVIEAATTKITNPFAITLAREVIALVVRYLPVAMKNPKDRTARYHLAYAALLGGISFDNGFLHYTHALEHPLSGKCPSITHGLGLAMLLPAVIKNIYAARADVLADILSPIIPDLKPEGSDTEKAARGIEKWLFEVGAKQKLTDEGFSESDIAELADLVFSTPSLTVLLSVAPTNATREAVEQIFRESLKPLDF